MSSSIPPENDPKGYEFAELVARHLAGELTEEEQAVLGGRLREDVECRREFVKLSLQAQMLTEQFATRIWEAPRRPLRQRMWEGMRRSVGVMRISPYREIAAILVIGLIVGALMVGPKIADYYADPMALVVGGLDPQWESAEGPLNQSGFLLREPQYLKGGVVEISLKNGVRLVVQGPARFCLNSQSVTRLDLGRITVKVPKEAIGFAVLMPGGKVTDLGTEFGVEVGVDRATHMEVFQGKVEAENAVKQKQVVQADQAVAIDGGGKSLKMEAARPESFVRQEQLGAMALGRWKSYSERLRQDPSLVAYYTFDNQAEASYRLLNRAAATLGRSDGVIENCAWDEGRMPGKAGLRFNGKDSRVKVEISGSLPSMTLGMWVKLERLNEGTFTSLLVSEGAGRAKAFHFQIWKERTINASIRQQSIEDMWWGFYSPEGLFDVRSPRWQWVVFVYDSRARNASFYMDGRLVLSQPIKQFNPEEYPIEIGAAQIGNFMDIPGHRANRGMKGSMDELVIFSRALSEGEIQGMYKAGMK